MRVLVSRSLEHPTLPDAEFGAVMAAHGITWEPGDVRGRLRLGKITGPKELVASACTRLAMTNEVCELWVHTDSGPSHLSAAARAHPLPDDAPFLVRAERTAPDRSGGPLSRTEVERILGAAWQDQAPVSLRHPGRVVRAWLDDDDALIGERLWARDRAAFEARAAKLRPFFAPVSGDPRWMRAVVNLARVPAGGTVYDPLCGTGGLLLEAALCGVRAIGSDIDPEMVAGTQQNLRHFGTNAEAVFQSDVRDAPERLHDHLRIRSVDALVTDLPYGQSASTQQAAASDVAAWTLETAARLVQRSGHVVVGTSSPAFMEGAPSVLELLDTYALRVHRSMTRTYHVYRRR